MTIILIPIDIGTVIRLRNYGIALDENDAINVLLDYIDHDQEQFKEYAREDSPSYLEIKNHTDSQFVIEQALELYKNTKNGVKK